MATFSNPYKYSYITTIPVGKFDKIKKEKLRKNILPVLFIILFITGNNDITKPSQLNNTQHSHFKQHGEYQVPFSDENVLAVLTSEHCSTMLKTKYPFHTTLHSNWSYPININNLQHSINGNRRLGYNLLTWNC